MKFQTISYYSVFFTLIFIVDSSVAFNCDTTLIANDPGHDYNDQVYLADCKIEMQEFSPFIISSGHTAKLTAEQIRLDSGFHAQRGSHFHAKLRDCIRNPDKNLGYASWGDAADESWMRPVAEAFVNNFDKQEGLIVELKYDDEDLDPNYDIFNLYLDHSLVAAGKDDVDYYVMPPIGQFWGEKKILKAEGVDKGMFYFHIGHGGGNPDGPNVRDGEMNWMESILGNCSKDGSAKGELRYLLLCACRSLAHGPLKQYTDASGNTYREYNRPSEFDSAETDHANVFERLDPVLSENMRMICGFSTTAGCHHTKKIDNMASLYFDQQQNVAESWGLSYLQRRFDDVDVYTTPLCIARGNANTHDLRSPLIEDIRFTEKANPYDEALHVMFWERDTSIGTTDEYIEHNIGKRQIDFDRSTPEKMGPYKKVSHVTSRIQEVRGRIAVLEENIEKLPVLITAPSFPSWFDDESNSLRDEDFIKSQDVPHGYAYQKNTLTSKKTTNDKRPKVKINTRSGKTILSKDRKPVSLIDNRAILSLDEYSTLAFTFIRKQGWDEDEIGEIIPVRSHLQVLPLDSQVSSSKLLKVQHDITFFFRRRIPLGEISVKVFGSDNQIVVQMNNDGSVKSASKKWRNITQKIEGFPVKSYEEAYAEAVKALKYPGLYKLSAWDWAYKSITDDNDQEMMVVYYVFTFDPLSIVNECIDTPRVVEIQGHILEKIKGARHKGGQQRT